MNKITSLK